MSKNEVLLRRLDREIKARLKAEEISERKIAELYRVNRRLEYALGVQKKISEQLAERSRELEEQVAITKEERNVKSMLQSILASTFDYSIIAINLQGIILFWNIGASRNYGYDP